MDMMDELRAELDREGIGHLGGWPGEVTIRLKRGHLTIRDDAGMLLIRRTGSLTTATRHFANIPDAMDVIIAFRDLRLTRVDS